MLQLKNIGSWLRAWVLLAFFILLAGVLIGVIAKRWRMLHGTKVQASIYRRLYDGTANKSGVSYMIVAYSHPQGQALYAEVQTDSNIERLVIGQQAQVCYADDPRSAMLATDSSYSGKLIAMTLVILMLMYDGVTANHFWRNRRRDGYLPG